MRNSMEPSVFGLEQHKQSYSTFYNLFLAKSVSFLRVVSFCLKWFSPLYTSNANIWNLWSQNLITFLKSDVAYRAVIYIIKYFSSRHCVQKDLLYFCMQAWFLKLREITKRYTKLFVTSRQDGTSGKWVRQKIGGKWAENG